MHNAAKGVLHSWAAEQKCFLQLVSYGSKQISNLPYHVSKVSVPELYCYSYTCLSCSFSYICVNWNWMFIDCMGLISALSWMFSMSIKTTYSQVLLWNTCKNVLIMWKYLLWAKTVKKKKRKKSHIRNSPGGKKNKKKEIPVTGKLFFLCKLVIFLFSPLMFCAFCVCKA